MGKRIKEFETKDAFHVFHDFVLDYKVSTSTSLKDLRERSKRAKKVLWRNGLPNDRRRRFFYLYEKYRGK